MICKTCGTEFERDIHKPRQENCTPCGNHVISRKRRKKPTQNAKSIRLVGSLVNCFCQICGIEFKRANMLQVNKNKPVPSYCHNCRSNIVNPDYSDGMGFRTRQESGLDNDFDEATA